MNPEIKSHESLSLFSQVAQAVSIWVISYFGYYLFLPALGIDSSYSGSPIEISLYYLFWCFVAVFAFWDIYKDWETPRSRKGAYTAIIVGNIVVILYLFYILPLFPITAPNKSWLPPSELLSATSWYFLPKSMEIFLQQLLLVAIILSFHYKNFSLKTIFGWCAVLFGGTHLLLAFRGGFVYASIFTVVAVVSSFVFPYLILKVKNGFIYSYFIHWSFYAIVIFLTRVIFRL